MVVLWFEPKMKLLPITDKHRKIVVHAQVDDDLYPFLSRTNWHLDSTGYPRKCFQRKDGTIAHVSLHQVVFRCKYKRDPRPGREIDHIDRNKLNAQRSNLRELSPSFNTANAPKPRNNTSGYKGVSWHKRDKRWQARIRINREDVFLGYFTCKHEAARAVNQAYEKYFPTIAIPNPEAELFHWDQADCDRSCQKPL